MRPYTVFIERRRKSKEGRSFGYAFLRIKNFFEKVPTDLYFAVSIWVKGVEKT